MRHLDIIRAWKDEEYRLGLSDAERALLPAHPAGLMALTDAHLDAVEGGNYVVNFLWYLGGKLIDAYIEGPNRVGTVMGPGWNPAGCYSSQSVDPKYCS